MTFAQRTRIRTAVVFATGLLAAACGPGTAPTGQPPMVTLTAQTLEVVRQQFNQDADQARVVLLLSPT